MPFHFRTAGQIRFGRGEHRQAAACALDLGRRVLLVTGAASLHASGVLSPLLAELVDRGEHVEHVTVRGEPEVGLADALARRCREAACQVVLAIGGGSVLDVGKAVAALAQNAGEGIEYLEDVGRGSPRPLAQPPLPVVAVPTTAGSGSEVTRNAVLRVPERGVKRSLRSDLLLPRVAIVDPDLVATAPPRVAAAAGMDALCHLLEGYLSRGAQPTTDALATRGLQRMWRALHALADRNNAEQARPSAAETATVDEDLALASLWGGMVLANAGLGAVHGLVAPLGGLCGVAHGEGCACLLPATFRANAQALLRRPPAGDALPRLREILTLLTGQSSDVDQAVERLSHLRQRLGIPGLAAQGVHAGQLAPIIAQSRGGSMRTNPVELSDQELYDVLQASL
jgi:alcohol dehydrogenase class IV